MKALTALLVLLCHQALAADVRLSWDANSESNVVSYRLYWRNTNSGQSNVIAVLGRTNTTAKVSSLPFGDTVFTVTALDSEGLESGFSDEVTATNRLTAKFIIMLDNGTWTQAGAITDICKTNGWNAVNKIEGAWLISGVPDEFTSRTLAEKITQNSLIGAKIKLIIKLPENTTMTYWGNAPTDFWVWMAKFWGKPG